MHADDKGQKKPSERTPRSRPRTRQKATTLFLFNVGVEVGQLLFIAAVAVVAGAAQRVPMQVPCRAALVRPYAIGCLAMFWVIQRVAVF